MGFKDLKGRGGGLGVLTLAQLQLFLQGSALRQALCLHVGRENKLLQGGDQLLLLPPRGCCCLQSRDVNTARDRYAQTAACCHISHYGDTVSG